MDSRKQRIQDLNKLLKDDYDLLKKVEEKHRVEDDPIRQAGLEQDMKDISDRINKHQVQLNSLIVAIQNYPIDTVDEEHDNPFLDKPGEEQHDLSNVDIMLDRHVDLLTSAIQFYTKIRKKLSELSDISNWFDTGNVVGRDKCDYATTFFQTLSEIVQPFSKLLDETTSTEPRVDIVQFRYSLSTPLHSGVKLLDDLAQLIPTFTKSYTHSRDRLIRQEKISKALHNLERDIREINIHLALYKALLGYNLPKLNSLSSKLDVPYKVILADSREMKISQLIEYCKRNNNYYKELIREVL